MRRRRLLQLSFGSAAALSLASGVFSLLQPRLPRGAPSQEFRQPLIAIASALLDGSLPTADRERAIGMTRLLGRVDKLVAALPGPAQNDFFRLLALLRSRQGRRLFGNLEKHWSDASIAEVQRLLESMRRSSMALRQQAYLALHELVISAHFADSAAWSGLGYPGPMKI